MTGIKKRRLWAAAAVLITGAGIAIASYEGGRGSGTAIGVMIEFIAIAVVYYRLGRKDGDLGSVLPGFPADERQTVIQARAATMAFLSVMWVATIGYGIALGMRDSTWPFLLFAYVALGSYLVSWAVIRRRV
jgi:hypothetical protein